eukprot:CAMPEP_0118701634 /NCGR_PEP_ID=MMETSP0800-20121206/17374_1 /TAXON_ID=210618 ORGANISM="Striatella unipunctata, Strain CCMP2910" /NCGR_SAMPLE_ID=MMETSP0800 /ASSEMBLY_ACC=CAM_ASM_000638 /LENGTH=63 /DNA_ID=CAMNT_0006602605 /DNA_START=100 /DNA_END=291 /DNA_ORIENTATION=+
MGGCSSKKTQLGGHVVDDSVHVMLKHDKKKAKEQGDKNQAYVPRAEHPAVAKLKEEAATGEKN